MFCLYVISTMEARNTTFFYISVILLLIKCSNASLRVSPIVNTSLGQIRGLRADDGDFYMYMGIPYAQVNRSNVFGEATPQEPFDDVFDAFDDSAICPQIEEFNNTIVGSLDCMHINIYTPTTSSPTNLLPVLLIIIGGGFQLGFAGRYMYGPKYLIRHDVVVVVFNYRLGPYGFMCLNIPEVPGNGGMKDQVMAMRWIKANIEAFGGDPNKITAVGNSVGAMSLEFHLMSPMESFFEQGIIQSGPVMAITNTVTPENVPLEFAAYFGFDTNNIHEALTFLSGVNEYDLINATNTLGFNFGLCIEQQFDGVEGFLIEDWVLASRPKVKNMPIMMGVTRDESIGMTPWTELFLDGEFITNRLRSTFQMSDPSFEGMAGLVNRFYMGDEVVSIETARLAVNVHSDMDFNYFTYRTIDNFLNNGVGDLFFYVFSYVGDRNFVRVLDNTTVDGGAMHADELGYLFDMAIFPDPPTIEDQLIIDRVTTLWTNFVKYGNPTPEPTELLPVLWEPIKNHSAYQCLDLDTELSREIRPFYERIAFWDLFFEVNEHLWILPSSN